MSKHVAWPRRLTTGALALSMGLALLPLPALAKGAAVGADDTTPEWAVDDGYEDVIFSQADLPSRYDLRDEGKVTPVKSQSPWGTCWAFGGIAAAETSILSDLGTTYADSGLDLSERHLVFFSKHAITADVDPNQVGEGIYPVKEVENYEFSVGGGLPIYYTTLFSQGVGPLLEEVYPYRGVTGRTTLDDLNDNPEAEVWSQLEAAYEGITDDHEKIIQLQLERLKDKGIVDEKGVIDYYTEVLRKAYFQDFTYSKQQDWGIPLTNEQGTSNRLLNNGVVLNNGNVLPEYYDENGDLSSRSIRAIKQELVNGHGVSIMYYADQSSAYTARYEDGGIYAQCVDEKLKVNHGVCIVGYDDSYSADNFNAQHKPPADGAWIVKNSWGSQTDQVEVQEGRYLNGGTFGIKNDKGEATGYFYLSYYDRTIRQPESMEFGSDLSTGEQFYTLQYDYLPASNGFATLRSTDGSTGSDRVMSAANVFDPVDISLELRSVSASTTEENSRVTFAVYLLNDDAKDPTDGTLMTRFSKNFEYGGFHRVSLDRPVCIPAGKRFSVVATASILEGEGTRTYEVAASRGLNEEYSRAHDAEDYSKSVVNEGESYLYREGAWSDWSNEVSQQVSAEIFAVDNFSIKAYLVALPDNVEMYRLYNPNSGEHFYTASAAEYANLVKLGWADEGVGWTAPSKSSTPVYRLYNPNGGEHHYTMDATERAALVAAGWTDEGVGWYSDDGEGVALLREYNPNKRSCNHNYTTSKEEHDKLVQLGWADEGVAWYGVDV